MKRMAVAAFTCLILLLFLASCGGKVDADRGAPPPAQVEREQDSNVFKAAHPEKFPLATAGERKAAPELTVTGVISPDITRSVPAISLASGRAIEVKARLGDTVQKGQLLMRVRSNDVSTAYAAYRNAVASEHLTRLQVERARLLFEKGAIAKKDLEIAEQAEQSSLVVLDAAIQALKILGVTDLKDHPDGIVNVYAPISGVIIEQNVAAGGGVKTLDNSPNLFTIANLDDVWVMCDVYENNLSFVRIGDYADVRLNAFPDKVYKGRISNISPILDPNIRTAKVRLEMANPGRRMSIGMFVTATFYGQREETFTTLPSTAVLHLHDRDWVYVPEEGGQFRRVEVRAGKMLAGNIQEVTGIKPGQKVVANALPLQTTMEE